MESIQTLVSNRWMIIHNTTTKTADGFTYYGIAKT